jgi:hypothetical protein
MKVIVSTHREILLDVQGSNIVCYGNFAFFFVIPLMIHQWSGQQVQVREIESGPRLVVLTSTVF